MTASLLAKVWPGLFRDLVLNSLIASPLVPRPLRWRALRLYGLRIDKCFVSPGVWFGSSQISIGRGTFVNYGCMFNASGGIHVGSRVSIGMRSVFVTSSHEIGGPEHRAGRATSSPIVVGDGAWIGANVTILPGVTVGRGCVIAAGSVVTRDCEPDSVYAGVPARKVRTLSLADR